MANEYVYNNNDYLNENSLTQEEIAALLAQQTLNAEANTARRFASQQNMLRRRATSKRIGKFLGQQPGLQARLGTVRQTLNARRQAKARANFINATAKAARQSYKQKINTVANAQYGSNANLQAQLNEAGFLEGDEYNQVVENVQLARAGKNSFKQAAVAQILQTLKNASQNANASLYANTKAVLESEPRQHRQTVLKLAALDDLMIEEKKKLAVANTNEKARNAATKLYAIERLKEELDDARHMSKVPTPEQEARYAALIAGVNLNALNGSLYGRLVANNAALGAKNNAATRIQALARGRKGRKLAATRKVQRNLNALAVGQMSMIPSNIIAPLAAPVVAPPTKVQQNAARAARLARFAKKGGRKQ